MKRSTMMLTIAAGLAFSPLARAETMTKGQYQDAQKSIEADGNAALSRCDTMTANAKDICVAEAKGRQHVAKAELEAKHEPTAKNRNDVHVAKAEAAYKVSMERCDDRAGNDKDVCVKAAEAAKVHALSSAKSHATVSKANMAAHETSANADAKASAIGDEARKDAAGQNANAEYALAKEKCNSLAGNTRDDCVNDAKARFEQR
jgi:uncharacterized cupredoxin-like copper-binding protein